MQKNRRPFDKLLDMLDDDRPPFLGTWRRVYAATLLYLAGLISVFYVFTRSYR